MNHILETDRLILRPFTTSEKDLNFVYDLYNSPGWIQNIGDRGIRSLEDARHYVETKFLLDSDTLFTYYIMEDKINGKGIGTSGILHRNYMEIPDFGYAVLPQYYRQGYAFEVSIALLKYAHSILNLNKISAIVLRNNLPSVSLLKKCGLEFEKSIIQNEEELDVYLKYFNK